MSLNDFKAICRTDKYDDWSWTGPGVGHNYVNMFYDSICAPMKYTATAILEIGINKGHSHLLWSCYFPNAKIYGVDILEQPYPNHNRIELRGKTDGYTEETVEYYRTRDVNGYDLIVDDGPHTLDTQMFTLRHYWNLLKPNGYMVIEDVIGEPAVKTILTEAREKSNAVFFSPASSPNNAIFAILLQKSGA